MELLRIVLPLAAAGYFLWGAGQCAWRTLCPRRNPAFGRQGLPGRLWQPALLCLLVGAAVQGMLVGIGWSQGSYATLAQALDALFYGNTDARHYLDLARYGYGAGEAFSEQYLMIVFFPLFPWLLRLLNPFGWLDIRVLALVVQLPLFALAGTGLFAVTERLYGASTAWRALVLLLLSPASFFFWMPMTESLFLALTVWYVWCLEQGYGGRAAVLGVLAGLCRAPGALLTGLALLHLLERWRARKLRLTLGLVAALWGPALGLAGYFALNQFVYGRWNQYSVYQWEHWHQRLGLFTETIRYHLSYLAQWWQSDRSAAIWICLTVVVCIVLAFALLAAAARELPPSWLGYGLAYLLLTMGATWLLSAPRYAVALFVLPVGLAVMLRGRPRSTAVTGICLAAGSVAYTAAYLLHQPIY